MPLLDSLVPDISESLPAQLGSGTGLADTFPAGSGFDVSLGALSERFVVAAQRSGVDGYIVVGTTSIAWYTAAGVSGATGTLPTTGCTKPASMGSAVWIGHSGGVSKFVQSTGTVTTPWTASARTQVW